MTTVAFFKHEGFLCDSYFEQDILPGLKGQVQEDGDTLIFHELKDAQVLELRSSEAHFTNAVNDFLDELEVCGFSAISEFIPPVVHSPKLDEKGKRKKYAEENCGWTIEAGFPRDVPGFSGRWYWYQQYEDLGTSKSMCCSCAERGLMDINAPYAFAARVGYGERRSDRDVAIAQ